MFTTPQLIQTEVFTEVLQALRKTSINAERMSGGAVQENWALDAAVIALGRSYLDPLGACASAGRAGSSTRLPNRSWFKDQAAWNRNRASGRATLKRASPDAGRWRP
ncbi:MAG: hypothetical protein Q7R45_06975 [Sulfuricaulis sp.]|nr:hypothetical protein [Sulfuricaulis sp.]